jgi:hypothetical protein
VEAGVKQPEPQTIWHVVLKETGQPVKTIVGNNYSKCLKAAAVLLGIAEEKISLEDSGMKKMCCGKGTRRE